jgi:hypothetical protein
MSPDILGLPDDSAVPVEEEPVMDLGCDALLETELSPLETLPDTIVSSPVCPQDDPVSALTTSKTYLFSASCLLDVQCLHI